MVCCKVMCLSVICKQITQWKIVIVASYIALSTGEMEKFKEVLMEQLPQKLLISNHCIRLLESVGQGNISVNSVMSVYIPQ